MTSNVRIVNRQHVLLQCLLAAFFPVVTVVLVIMVVMYHYQLLCLYTAIGKHQVNNGYDCNETSRLVDITSFIQFSPTDFVHLIYTLVFLYTLIVMII